MDGAGTNGDQGFDKELPPWLHVGCHYPTLPQYKINGDSVKTLSPRQNERHFADDIFKCIFLNENIWISIKISLKFIPKCPINNIPALVSIMAWRRQATSHYLNQWWSSQLTHICVTRPQWVKPPLKLVTESHISCSTVFLKKALHIAHGSLYIPLMAVHQHSLDVNNWQKWDTVQTLIIAFESITNQ